MATTVRGKTNIRDQVVGSITRQRAIEVPSVRPNVDRNRDSERMGIL